MKRGPKRRRRPFHPESLESRVLLSTLIAEVDSGIDLNNAINIPYYDTADGYNAYTQQAANASGSNVADNSLNGGPGGHGSAVATSIVSGILATKSQPGASAADVKIMPIRVTNNSGGFDAETFNAIIRGIYYAAYHHAAVINVSIVYREYSDSPSYVPGNPDPSVTNEFPTFQDAINYANAKGAVVVTGAGNNHYKLDSTDPSLNGYAPEKLFPTQNLAANLIVAASTDASGNLTPVSNYGPTYVNLGAQANEDATSYAAGFISGVAGTVASLNPGLRGGTLVSLLESTARKYPQLTGLISTGGVVSPFNAVGAALAPTLATPASAVPNVVTTTSTTLSVLGADVAGESVLTYTWKVLSGNAVSFSPQSANGTNAGKTITASFSQPGNVRFEVTIANGEGVAITSDVSVSVAATATTIAIVPANTALADGASAMLSATAFDQFGSAMTPQPAFNWSIDFGGAGGTVGPAGLYTAPTSGDGLDLVRATIGSATRTVAISVVTPAYPGAVAIASGSNSAIASFLPDTDVSGGSTHSTSNAIDTSHIIDFAPEAVFQNERWSNSRFTYIIPGLNPGGSYTVRLLFAETSYQGSGQRVFNVALNGTGVLTNFDIYATAGGANKAVVVPLAAKADAAGRITLQYTNVVGGAKSNGIEIIPSAALTASSAPTPIAISLNQDGHDLANINDVPWPKSGPDGLQDVHVVLANLPTNLAIDHVRVDRIGGGGLYRSDGSPWSWSDVVVRASSRPGYYANTADVYFQPSPRVVDRGQPYAFDIFFAGQDTPVTVYARVTDDPNLPMPAALSLNQDGHDFANIVDVCTPQSGADGLQDVHVTLSNLPDYMAIDHIRVDRIGGDGLYSSDGSPWSWSDVVQRTSTAPGQYSRSADVYFQPSPNVVDRNQNYAFDIFFVGMSAPVTVYAEVTDNPWLVMPSAAVRSQQAKTRSGSN